MKHEELIDPNHVTQQIDEKFQEWKNFAFQNRAMETVIAFTLGMAFSKLATAISEGLIMPLVQWIGSFVGVSWREIVWSPVPNLNFEIGKFCAASSDFILTSIVLFIVWKCFGKKEIPPYKVDKH